MRSRRVLLVAVLGSLSLGVAGPACGDREATVVIDDVSATVQDDRRVRVDVVVRASEQTGASVGRYCVSVNWLGYDTTLLEPAPTYFGAFETLTQCAADLGDGDTRSFVFVSTRVDIPSGTSVRAQAIVGHEIQFEDTSTP
jgi:hypothetical protein